MGDLIGIRQQAGRGLVALACRHGLRSAALARLLRAEGLEQAHALAGGLAAIRPPTPL